MIGRFNFSVRELELEIWFESSHPARSELEIWFESSRPARSELEIWFELSNRVWLGSYFKFSPSIITREFYSCNCFSQEKALFKV